MAEVPQRYNVSGHQTRRVFVFLVFFAEQTNIISRPFGEYIQYPSLARLIKPSMAG